MILYNFRRDLENLINNSGLSIDAVYFVLKDVMSEIEDLYRQEIQREAAMVASQSAEIGQPGAEVAVAAMLEEENKTE